MAASYLPYLPDQDFLLPPSLGEWLPDGHLAHFISDTVDALDLAAFHARYDKGGPRNQPFHPAMMVKVLLYGYATGVFSSRKVAAMLHENVAFRVLSAEYNADVNDAQWILSVYVLALGISTPLSGFLADRIGIKKVYLAALSIFVIGSLLCGIASTA